ncbi:MAG: sensor histidine kinase [Bacteroidales bacterium]|nr:sensor histidine kinase [Bacteroidales bacterium]
MKNSVRTTLHIGFWLSIPVLILFYSWSQQADSFFGMQDSKSFLQILFDKVQQIVQQPDLGADPYAAKNIVGITYKVFMTTVLPLGVFYLFYLIFLPNMLRRKNALTMTMPVAFIIAFPLIFNGILSYFVLDVLFNPWNSLGVTYMISLFFAASGTFFRLLDNWLITQKRAKQNLQSELALLRNQVNPHFLFNTLNNIDSLIKRDVDQASESLLKLSDILRYMIYECNVDETDVAREIKHIESYIDLQRMQFANHDLVVFSVMGNPKEIRIAPMLFIPFIENAFKHCNRKQSPQAIKVAFNISGKKVHFVCENLFDPMRKTTKDSACGIGLSTVNRRLELIYPGRHQLQIREDNTTFRVELTIDTHAH